MMMRLNKPIAVLALGAAALMSAAQDTSQKVSFSAPAGIAKNLLPELSKAAGVNFLTSPQTAGEVLLIDVKDVTLKDLMERIAKVAAAEWKQEGESFRLIRSQALAAQQERAFLTERANRLKAEQAKLTQELAGMPALSAAEAKRAHDEQAKQIDAVRSAIAEGRPVSSNAINPAVMNLNPGTRLMLRLLAAMPPAELAALGAGTRTVYSSAPTRAQKPLPGQANRAIGDFLREYEIWLQANPPKAASEPATGVPMIMFDGGLKPMQGGLGKVLLVVSRTQFGNNLQCELRVADAAGDIVTSQFRALNDTSVPLAGPGRAATPEAAATPTPPAGEKPLEISAPAREHAAFLAQSPSRGNGIFIASAGPSPRGGGAAIRVTNELVLGAPAGGGGGPAKPLPVNSAWADKLVHPDRSDPLSFAVSELYLALARDHGKNLVASLTDSLLIPLGTRAQQPIAPSQLLQIARNELSQNVEEDQSWMTVMPKFPAYERSIRIDREQLANLLTSIQKEGRMSLDALSRYALSRNLPAPNPALDGRYLNALFPNAFGEFNQAVGNWRMHQLYATLDAGQRKRLADGGAINLGALTPQQFRIVDSLVFDDMGGPYLNRAPAPNPGGANRAQSETQMRFAAQGGQTFSFGNGSSKLSDERTEFLAGGLPGAGTLTLTVNNQEAALAMRQDGSAEPRFFTPESYGAYQTIGANLVINGGNGPAPQVPQYDTFRPAIQQTLDFHFQLTSQASIDRQLRDAWFVQGSTPGGYEMLPETYRQRVDEAAKRMKDARATVNIGGGPARVRPPQP